MSTDDVRARRWAAAYAEQPRLLRIARRRTASAAEAEDCVSEAMLRCVEFESLDEERLAAFLTTVTLRLCADQHRARSRLLRVGGHLVGGSDEPSPEEDICDRAEAAWLVESLRAMSPHQRRVVAARAEGLSCDDVARRLGMTVDGVKSAVARVRLNARAALAKTLGVVGAPLARRSAGSLAASGAVAGAVAGVTVGGLLLMPPAPHRRPEPSAAPPAAVERVVPVLLAPVAAPVTVRADVARVVPVAAVQRTVRRTAPTTFHVEKKKRTVATLPHGEIRDNDNEASMEEQIVDCLLHPDITLPSIGCTGPEGERSS